MIPQGDLCICTVLPTKLQIAPARCLLLIFNQSATIPCDVTDLQQTQMTHLSIGTPQNAEGTPPKHRERGSYLSAVTPSAVTSLGVDMGGQEAGMSFGSLSQLNSPLAVPAKGGG